MALKRHGVRVPAAPPCFSSGTKSSSEALVNEVLALAVFTKVFTSSR